MSLTTILRQPYPKPQSARERVLLCVGVSAFVAFFLLAFRPFGLAAVPAGKILGYGAITFVAMAFSFFALPAVFKKQFREEEWTAGREIFMSLVTILLIGAGNFLYTTALGYFHFDVLTFMYFQLITLAVGIFPLTVMVLLRQNRSMKKYLREAAEISQTLHHDEKEVFKNSAIEEIAPQIIMLTSDDGKLLLECNADEFICATAADNYAEIVLFKNGKTSTRLIRMTMAKLAEETAAVKNIYRCHRSHLVNLDKITTVHGNSQGLKLVLDGFEKEIPVARAKSGEIRSLLA
ncbi:MAG TPA: LytTR family DNA-binding domain-containing protein [Patescibacteria group bacterium]|nr:LytTR family DNA-binding domain-containing protein [Patescibacteria group bacterium]